MSVILIADTPEGVATLENILAGHELVVVDTLASAINSLNSRIFDLIVVGLHFDESHMFEVIREARKSQKNSLKPIICFSSRATHMSRIMHESLEVTTRTLGAWMYLSEHAYNVYQNPNAELRRIMERCLSEEARKEVLQQRTDIQKQRDEIQHLRSLLELQEWTPETKEYLDGLRSELELLLNQVQALQSTAGIQRASVNSSRDLNDRVSQQVTSNENKLTDREGVQSSNESRQDVSEGTLKKREEIKQTEGQRKNTSDKQAKAD